MESGKKLVCDVSEASVISLVSKFFDRIGYVDPITLGHNMNLASKGGMSESDRTISRDTWYEFWDNYATLYGLLIIAPDFRKVLIECISLEIGLDNCDDQSVDMCLPLSLSNENWVLCQ